MALVLKIDELFRYLRGEITIEQWEQGRELLELFSSDESSKGSTFQISIDKHATGEQPTTSAEKVVPGEDAKKAGESDEEGEEEGEEDDDAEEEMDLSQQHVTRSQADDDDEGGPSTAEDEQNLPVVPGADAMDIEMQLDRVERKGHKRKGKRSRGKPRGRHNLVPKPLRGLMGEAHLCFARGAHDEAVTMCSEIIKQAPKCPDPFQLLGMIYEDKGQVEKSLQFSLIAAHLNPTDVEEWTKLAETCLELGNIKQALYCYTKALRYDPNNISLLWEKANLYDQLQDHKKAMECYHSLLKVLPPEKAEESLQLARDMVKTCHQGGDITTAIEIMETTISKHPDRISSEDVNMLTELYMSSRQFHRALQVISDHCGVMLKSKSHTTGMEQLTLIDSSQRPSHDADDIDVIMSEGIPIDLRIKLGICLVHCGHFTSAKDVLRLLFGESPEEMGDLYLDVAEAYAEVGQYQEAKPILGVLVKTSNYNLPAVWLRYAECLNNLGGLKEASVAYRKVLEQVPSHLDARLNLATIEKQLGNADAALKVLSLEEVSDSELLGPHDIQLVYQRCMLQHSQGLLKEFAKTARVLMMLYLRMDLSTDDIQQELQMTSDYSVVKKDDWFRFFQKTCEALIAVNESEKAAELTIRVMRSNIRHPDRQPLVTDPVKKEKVEYLAIWSCFLSGQYTEAFNFIKGFIYRTDGNCVAGWNLFNLITNYTMDTRHHKFCLRLCVKFLPEETGRNYFFPVSSILPEEIGFLRRLCLTVMKFPESFGLSVLNGHNAFVSGSFKLALGEYVRGIRMAVNDPMMNFCIGLCMLHIACQKYSMKKHSLIIQGFSFLKRYHEQRGECQETLYNLGRALHQLGLFHLSVHYYHKALDMPPSIAGDSRYNLQREIAYNLSLIYQNSGNHEMAGQLLYQYVVV